MSSELPKSGNGLEAHSVVPGLELPSPNINVLTVNLMEAERIILGAIRFGQPSFSLEPGTSLVDVSSVAEALTAIPQRKPSLLIVTPTLPANEEDARLIAAKKEHLETMKQNYRQIAAAGPDSVEGFKKKRAFLLQEIDDLNNKGEGLSLAKLFLEQYPGSRVIIPLPFWFDNEKNAEFLGNLPVKQLIEQFSSRLAFSQGPILFTCEDQSGAFFPHPVASFLEPTST